MLDDVGARHHSGCRDRRLQVREDGRAIGFATLDWKWSMLKGARIGYLEDLFVDPAARGRGTADALIQVCADRCRELGMPAMAWLTAPGTRPTRGWEGRRSLPVVVGIGPVVAPGGDRSASSSRLTCR